MKYRGEREKEREREKEEERGGREKKILVYLDFNLDLTAGLMDTFVLVTQNYIRSI